jgi:subtilisin-like proprotein convertase family protein/WD40 repeat protein
MLGTIRKARVGALLQSAAMPSVTHPTEFFVVGGPVQPERSCYVERGADRAVEAAVRERRLCYVLGPRAIGKTSLLLRAARTLRRAGFMVSVLDVRRIVEHSDAAQADSALRALAAQIGADLALGIDVDAWWTARHARMGENRLAEFFWEVVLTNTTAPIALLIDDIDAVLDSAIGAEFLAAVSACYACRDSEPDFARLNFVIAGCTTKRGLTSGARDALLAEAEVIEPADFSADEAYRLAVAFGGEPALAQALLDRICVWTGGHPYMTQRVARGVARKGGRLEDVEKVVGEQLLTPEAADAEPLLRHMRALLAEPSRVARRASRTLERVASGAKLKAPADPAVADRLSLSGAVRVDVDRRLTVRNRIVKELVSSRWLKGARSTRRWAVAAAVLVAAIAAGAYWYTQRVPLADTATLASASADLASVEQAYRRLRALPGFVERADRMWIDALERRSGAATELAEVAAIDAYLRELPGRDEAADRLFSEFWLRRARDAAHAEQRDAALLYAQRAASLPAADTAASATLAQFVGDDYRLLERSLRLTTPPVYWHMRFADAALLSLDAELKALRTPFGTAAGLSALGAAPLELTALTHTALARELAVRGEGTAGELTLTVAVQHPAADELLVTLRAPSGAAATVAVPRGDPSAVETIVYQASQGTPLAALADEALDGAWRLTVVDRNEGNSGVLVSWQLAFGEASALDAGEEPFAIPDPLRVATVMVRAAGERAVASPTEQGAIGSVAVWNLATGRLEHDFTLAAPLRTVAIDATGTRVLGATASAVALWSADEGALLARIGTQTEFALPPAFSADGAYVAIAERVDGGNPLYSVLRSSDASLVTSIEGPADVESWELGPGARYFALVGPASVVRVVDSRRGEELVRVALDRALARLLHTADGELLVTVDEAGAIASWPLVRDSRERSLGRSAVATGVSIAAEAGRLAFPRGDGSVAVVDARTGAALFDLRMPRTTEAMATELAADGSALVTQSGNSFRLWRLPSRVVSAPPPSVVPTALGLDRGGEIAAVGLPSGQLAVGTVAQLAGLSADLAFVGHRGPITAVDIDAAGGVVATGGDDGIVRLWDSRSGAPTGIVMQPATAAIEALALSADARSLASAAEATVRVAAIADGNVILEATMAGPIGALEFIPGDGLAIGDASGTIALVSLSDAQRVVARLEAATTALTYTADGASLAAGDANGGVTVVDVAAADARATRRFAQSVRWLGFDSAGMLLVATDTWLHALDAATLAPLASKFVALPQMASFVALSSEMVRVVGVSADGEIAATDIDIESPPSTVPPDAAALVARDWSAALGLRLDDNGAPITFDP